MRAPRDILECQQCGDELKELTPLEAQKVANNPYNYVVYCRTCKRDIEKLMEVEYR